MLNVQISSVCLERKWALVANSGYFRRSFKNTRARYSSNFGNKLQMVVGIGKEYGLCRIFTCRDLLSREIGVTAQNSEQPIRLPNGLLYPRVEVEPRTHFGDEIEYQSDCEICELLLLRCKCDRIFDSIEGLKTLLRD